MLREFDIAAKAFVSDGFYLPEAKGGTDWLDRDTLLLSSAYGRDMATKSGYSRTVRLWRRGSIVDQAPVLFETHAREHGRCGRRSIARETRETVWFADKPAFFDTIVWLGDRSGPKIEARPADRHPHRIPSRLDGREAPHGMDHRRQDLCARHAARHLAAGVPRPAQRDFTVLFEPGERRALQHFFWSDGQLVVVDPR